MEFFDEALNKAKETFNTVSQKTEEFISLEKKKYAVSSLKSKLEKDYAQLGKYYYSVFKDSEEIPENANALFTEIKTKIEDINKLNEEIASAKAKRICPVCGVAVPEDAVYCNACGAKLIFDSEEK